MAMFKAGNAFSKKQQSPTAVPAPAPAASRRPLGGSKLPSMSRSAAPAVAPTTTRGVPTDNYGNLYVGNRRRQSAPVAPNSAAQATAMQQFNQSQQGAMNRANSVAQFNQGQQAAMQQFNAANMANISKASQVPATPQQNVALLQAAKVVAAQNAQRTGVAPAPAAQVPQTPSKAMQAYMAAEKAGTAGNMAKPAFRKGGAVKKKTGYAKGGAVMCGASMLPDQKGKK